MALGEWQIKDACWQGEPVCLACASATTSIFTAAGSLKWRLKDSSVWPPAFHEEPSATAVVVGNHCGAADEGDEDLDDRDAAAAAAAAAATAALCPSNDVPSDHRPSLSLSRTPKLDCSSLPPLPRACKAPVLRKKGEHHFKTNRPPLPQPQPSTGVEPKHCGGWDFVYKLAARKSCAAELRAFTSITCHCSDNDNPVPSHCSDNDNPVPSNARIRRCNLKPIPCIQPLHTSNPPQTQNNTVVLVQRCWVTSGCCGNHTAGDKIPRMCPLCATCSAYASAAQGQGRRHERGMFRWRRL
jgi:hypothetical protein